MALAEPQALMLAGGQTRQVANSWLNLEFHMKPVPSKQLNRGFLVLGSLQQTCCCNAM